MNANQPAYPMPSHSGPTGELATPHFGLTKRELIAAMALQGLLADPQAKGGYSGIADSSVKFADALLAKLKETEPK